MNKYLLFFTLILLSNTALAQFEELKYELFDNRQKITFKPDTSKLDTRYLDHSLLEDTSKYIVDSKKILLLLDSIARHEPQSSITDLLQIYKSQFEYYYEDWGIIMQNRYHEGIAKEYFDQHLIQYKFENTLKCLSLKNASADSIWTVITTDFERDKLGSSFRYDSPDSINFYEERMHEIFIYASHFGFEYAEPFIFKLKEQYIESLKRCKCPVNISECKVFLLYHLRDEFSQFEDDTIAQLLINNKDCYEYKYRYTWFPVLYVQNHYNEELLTVLLHGLFKQEYRLGLHNYINHIYNNPSNRKIFNKILSSYIKKGHEVALYDVWQYSSWKTLHALRIASWKYKSDKKLQTKIKQQKKSVKYKLYRKWRYGYQVKRML